MGSASMSCQCMDVLDPCFPGPAPECVVVEISTLRKGPAVDPLGITEQYITVIHAIFVYRERRPEEES